MYTVGPRDRATVSRRRRACRGFSGCGGSHRGCRGEFCAVGAWRESFACVRCVCPEQSNRCGEGRRAHYGKRATIKRDKCKLKRYIAKVKENLAVVDLSSAKPGIQAVRRSVQILSFQDSNLLKLVPKGELQEEEYHGLPLAPRCGPRVPRADRPAIRSSGIFFCHHTPPRGRAGHLNSVGTARKRRSKGILMPAARLKAIRGGAGTTCAMLL
jgi:hypothetical protein